MKTEDGRLYVISGASRSGKTAWAKKQSCSDARLAAWDPEGQWAKLPGWTKATTRPDLWKALNKPGRVRVAYVTDGDLKEEFNVWAKVVFYVTRFVGPTSAIGEELADVSTPNKAPQHWGILIRRGLKYGGNLYCISQRWAEADKTAFGNASAFILFRLSSVKDMKYINDRTGADLEELKALKRLEYIERCAITGSQSKKKLKF